MQVGYRQKSRFWSNSYRRLLNVRTTKWQKQLRTTLQCRSHSRRLTIECLFVTACSMDQYAEEKRREKNLIVRSGISESETTNNKRLRSTFCIEAIQTRSIARPLCDSRASCIKCLMTTRRTKLNHSIVVAAISQWRRRLSICLCQSSRWSFWAHFMVSSWFTVLI